MARDERVGELKNIAGAAHKGFVNLTHFGIVAESTNKSYDWDVDSNRRHHLLIDGTANVCIFNLFILKRIGGVLVSPVCVSTGRIATRD